MVLPNFLLSTLMSRKNPVQIFKVPTYPGLGFPACGFHCPTLAQGLAVLRHLILLYFILFFCLPTVLEVKTLFSVMFQLFSL